MLLRVFAIAGPRLTGTRGEAPIQQPTSLPICLDVVGEDNKNCKQKKLPHVVVL